MHGVVAAILKSGHVAQVDVDSEPSRPRMVGYGVRAGTLTLYVFNKKERKTVTTFIQEVCLSVHSWSR